MDSTEAVIKVFNTWQYKRAHPHRATEFQDIIKKSLANNTPIPFIMYWGKGKRNHITDKEKRALAFLNEMFKKIENVHKSGAMVTLIFTDTHATLNGHSNNDIELYFGDIKNEAHKFGYTSVLLSEFSPLKLENLHLKVQHEKVDPQILTTLKFMAQKHCHQFSAEIGAKYYYWQNQQEKLDIGKKFPDCIFLTNNSPKLNFLFPDELPIFYMYSTSKGHSEKPWFN